MEESLCENSPEGRKEDLYHVICKVPYGDSPYAKAKHAQLVDKDPEAAIVLFWKAINAKNKVESALKDMAIVMKQLDRCEEALEAIKSFKGLCNKQSQESLDNVLIDLYKKCGRTEAQIELIKRKLRLIYQGGALMEGPQRLLVPMARSSKFPSSKKQQGKFGLVLYAKSKLHMAELVFRKAQMIDPDANKACNLGLCPLATRYEEAHLILEDVLQGKIPGSDDIKSRKRADELATELRCRVAQPQFADILRVDADFMKRIDQLLNTWSSNRSRRLLIFEEITPLGNQLAYRN